ncbi:MAG: CYTH domain-containing protein [Leptothrix ochracea]|uniref:CYTH domain-containing protein n=2 Tax=Leptothrix ochracea TaxID=735331 RepID=UPI0034E2E895
MTTEIELKYQIPAEPAERLAGVREHLARLGPLAVLPLQARYLDTPERSLGAKGLAWRLRREGGPWVQTLKGRGDDVMTRLEHNVELDASALEGPDQEPVPKVERHAGTPAGEALMRALAAAPEQALTVRFTTDIQRTWVRVQHGGALIELALDEGSIAAAGQRLAVCELEFELIEGRAADMLAFVRPWIAAHGLWLDVRSKAERGDRLARAQLGAGPVATGDGLAARLRNAAETAEFGEPAQAALARSSAVQEAFLDELALAQRT